MCAMAHRTNLMTHIDKWRGEKAAEGWPRTRDLAAVLQVDCGEAGHVRNGAQALVRERCAALQVQVGHAPQRCQRFKTVIYERHMPPPIQAQRPA